MTPQRRLRAGGPALGGMGSRALTRTMRSPQDELKPGAGRGLGLALPFVCVAAGLRSVACNMAKQRSKATGDRISSVSGNIMRNAQAVSGGRVSVPRTRMDASGALWALTPLRALSLSHLCTSSGVCCGGHGAEPLACTQWEARGPGSCSDGQGFDTMPRGSCEWVSSHVKERGKLEA